MIMTNRTAQFKKFNMVQGDVEVKLDLSRFEKQFKDAQFFLDSQVMTDMVPYMPMQTGTFINLTRMQSASLAGTGNVVAAAPPYGRYLYEGKVMVDSVTGKGAMKISTGPGEFVWRHRKGAKLVATDRPLNYNKGANPKVTDHWFDAAKKEHCKAWVKGVKQRAGGG